MLTPHIIEVRKIKCCPWIYGKKMIVVITHLNLSCIKKSNHYKKKHVKRLLILSLSKYIGQRKFKTTTKRRKKRNTIDISSILLKNMISREHPDSLIRFLYKTKQDSSA